MQYLFKKFPLKMGAIRIVCTEKQMAVLSDIVPDMHPDVYDVMQIDL